MPPSIHPFPLLTKNLSTQRDFLITVLDAVPSMVLVVGADYTVHGMNTKAAKAFGLRAAPEEPQRVGEFLNCANAVTSELGCGQTDSCEVCMMREAVGAAARKRDVFQKTARMQRIVDGTRREVFYLLTATPFNYDGKDFVLLTLEDLSRVEGSSELVPICAQCKKIRNKEEGWDPPEVYMKSRAGVDFSHTICPDCLRTLYPSYYKA